jgi:hypothetical protein
MGEESAVANPPPLVEDAINVRVAVRCRPLSTQEVDQGRGQNVVQISRELKTVTVFHPNSGKSSTSVAEEQPPKAYTFDEVFGPGEDQLTVYNTVARPIVENVLRGYNGAYFPLAPKKCEKNKKAKQIFL